MAGANKLLTAGGGGVILTPATSIASDVTVQIPSSNGTIALQETKITSGTSVASTSGTSIDFTGIPSWVKRITVMLNGVSTNGTSAIQVQIGSGSITTSGYNSAASNSGNVASAYTSGFPVNNTSGAANLYSGVYTIANVSSNTWTASGSFGGSGPALTFGAGSIALGGTLDRVRITTVNGTDTFDAGSINILYE